MRSFFNLDNPLMQFLNTLTDIVILNVICLICCIPVVTIGASLTALHYVTIRMARKEEGYIIRDFFKSFRQNFIQSTVIWLLFLVISFFFYVDLEIFYSEKANFPKILEQIIYVLYLFVWLTAMYAFPVLSRFSNTIRNTIKNAFLMSILNVFKTFLMAIVYVIPFFLLSLQMTLIDVLLLVGVAGPAYINSFIWKGILQKYEPREEKFKEADDRM
ncbi:MAG: YesL family protein [Lachnospiraceae bacterium]|nr:YesL family protein [Lachnospiraceae bacterium]